MELSTQIISLFVIALPVSVIAWTVTHEEIFREPREFCVKRSKESPSLFWRKFFYVWTCEYCFSFYVTALILLITHYKLLYEDWRGYLVSGFALIWIANIYMSLFFLLRTGIKKEGMEIKKDEKELQQ
jgi:hypothetical protein